MNHFPLRRLVVTGESMLPTLHPGDRVLVLRLAVRRGDLVALVDPRDPGRIMIKRLAAVVGRVVYRYHPEARRGRLAGRRSGER